MSTRSALAYIPTKKEIEEGYTWKGVYCHWDGYSTARGHQIWEILNNKFLKNPGEFGVANSGDPKNAVKAFIDIYIKGHPGGWSSFPDNCYCHEENWVLRDGVRNSKLTSKKNDPLFIEWVYILNPEDLTLTILSSKKEKEKWVHRQLVKLSLLDSEPDWETIEIMDSEDIR